MHHHGPHAENTGNICLIPIRVSYELKLVVRGCNAFALVDLAAPSAPAPWQNIWLASSAQKRTEWYVDAALAVVYQLALHSLLALSCLDADPFSSHLQNCPFFFKIG